MTRRVGERGRAQRFTRAELDTIVKLWPTTATDKAICHRLKCSPQSLHYWARGYLGLKNRTDARADAAKELLK